MTNLPRKREFDVILWGVTGWTGVHLLEHFISKYPNPFAKNGHNIKWTFAARNEDKLKQVMKMQNCEWLDKMPFIIVDSQDESRVAAAVRRSKCIATVVGPFARYGEILVKQCALNGTHYTDITGEANWVAEMKKKYASDAEKSGAMIISFCGCDSVPTDIGVFSVVNACNERYQKLHKSDPIMVEKSFKVRGFITGMKQNNRDTQMNGGGGTLASVMEIFDASSLSQLREFSDPYQLCPKEDQNIADKGHYPQVGIWRVGAIKSFPWTTISFMASVNEKVARLSRFLLPKVYGGQFSYHEATAFKYPFMAIFLSLMGMFFTPLLLLKPVRMLIKRYMPKQSQLPPPKPLGVAYKPGSYTMEFICDATYIKENEQVKISGRGVFELPDEMVWTETSKMLAEAALTLVVNEAEVSKFSGKQGGFLTTACLGMPYVSRLRNTGIKIHAVAE